MNNLIKLATAMLTSLLGLQEIIAAHDMITGTTPAIKYWALVAGAILTTLIIIEKIITIKAKIKGGGNKKKVKPLRKYY
jgi:ABC-type arginine transport system permease subunit